MQEANPKVAMVVHHLPEKDKKTGGVSVVAQRLAEGFVELGLDVTVFSLNPPSGDVDFKWHPIVSNRLFQNLASRRVLDMFLIPIILSFKNLNSYDLIHFHGNDTFFFGKRPRFRTMHGSSLREMSHTGNRLRKVVLGLAYLFERFAVLQSDYVFCIGSETAEIYNLPHSNVIGNPVDLSLFKPGPKSEFPQVFFNGYWKGRKRGEFIYRIFVTEVLKKIPNARLVFLGDNCPPHPQVDLIQGATDLEMARIYRESWVFAYPSTYEGFGLPYVEAMASGTTVLASPNSGANLVLENGRFGSLAPDDQFGGILIDLLKNSDLRKHMEELGLDKSKEFGRQSICNEYISKFNSYKIT